MEIEKTLAVAAPSARVWELLLDPKVMAGCVPGMQSIDVISDTEYKALMQVKVSFLSARFRLHTRIVEQRAPSYLRAEGTGEDASVASSLKQQTELFLSDLPGGQTELRMKVKVDVLGRLGAFGLGVMKTKADRMWDEFGRNLVARLEAGDGPQAETVEAEAPAPETAAPPVPVPPPHRAEEVQGVPAVPPSPAATVVGAAQHWWQRLTGGGAAAGVHAVPAGGHVRIEIRRADETITVHWPAAQAQECARWLDGYLQARSR